MASKLEEALKNALQITDATDEEYAVIAKELNLGCEIGDWKEFCIELQKELIEDPEHKHNKLEHQYRLGTKGGEGVRLLGVPTQPGMVPLDLLDTLVSLGIYPPTDLLLVILNQYNSYLACEGAISAETAFFGDPKGKGVYAKRKVLMGEKRKVFMNFSHVLANARAEGDRRSVDDIIQSLMEEKCEDIPASFPNEEGLRPFPNPRYEVVKYLNNTVVEPGSFRRYFDRYEGTTIDYRRVNKELDK